MKTRLFAALSLLASHAWAQTTDLVSVLNHFQQKEEVYFSFDADVMKKVVISVDYKSMSLDEFIGHISNEKPIEFSLVGDNFYALKTKRATYQLQLSDEGDSLPVSNDVINVLVNGSPIAVEQKTSGVEFDYQFSAKDALEIYALGYERWVIDPQVLLNQRSIERSMTPLTMELTGVIIEDYLTKGINLNATTQSIDIAVSDLPLLPGETDGDLFASLAAIPGVSTPDNRPGNLFIRGSATDQSLVLYDDIPIYHRGHYFGMISPYNPLMVDEVKVYRSGYHPRLGGRVGGAVEIRSTGDDIEKVQGGIGTNTLYGLGYVKAPLANKKLMLSIGARKSYPVTFNSPKLTAISESVFDASSVTSTGELPDVFEVDFQDYAAKLSIRPNLKHQIDFSAIYASTQVDYVIQSIQQPEENGFENVGINAKWKAKIQDRWDVTTSLTQSYYQFLQLGSEAAQGSYGVNLPGQFAENVIKDLSVNEELSYTGEKATLQAGVNYSHQELYFGTRNVGREDSTQVVALEDRQSASLVSPYFNYQLTNQERFYMQLGIRGTYYSQLGSFRLEPRLFANYQLTDQFQLKGSAGLYNQYLGQVKELQFSKGGFDNELWLLAERDYSDIVKGYQYMFGGILTAGTWVFDLESYYKIANDVTYYLEGQLAPTGEFLSGLHEMFGVDLFIKTKVGDNGSFWTGYSNGDIHVVLDRDPETTYTNKYSQPHNLYIGGALHQDNFKLSTGWRLTSGQYARSFDFLGAQADFTANQPTPMPRPDPMPMPRPQGPGQMPVPVQPSPQNPFDGQSDRYPMLHWLDVSASYKLPKTDSRKLSYTFGLSVINVFDVDNITDRVYRQDRRDEAFVDRDAIGFAPNLMILVEF